MDVSLSDAFPRSADLLLALQQDDRPDYAALEVRPLKGRSGPPVSFVHDAILFDVYPAPRPRKLRTRRERRERNAKLQAEASALGVTAQELRLARDAATRLAPPRPRFNIAGTVTGRLTSSAPNPQRLPLSAEPAVLHEWGTGPFLNPPYRTGL